MFSKRCLMTLFCIIVCVNVSYQAQAIRKPVPKPAEFADQEGCYDPDLNKVLPYKVPFYSDDCSKSTCKENGDIVIVNCGAIYVSDDFVLVKGDKSLPYPECCDTVDLKQNNVTRKNI